MWKLLSYVVIALHCSHTTKVVMWKNVQNRCKDIYHSYCTQVWQWETFWQRFMCRVIVHHSERLQVITELNISDRQIVRKTHPHVHTHTHARAQRRCRLSYVSQSWEPLIYAPSFERLPHSCGQCKMSRVQIMPIVFIEALVERLRDIFSRLKVLTKL